MSQVPIRLILFIKGLRQAFNRRREKKRLSDFILKESRRIQQLPDLGELKKGTLIIKCDDIGDFMAWQQVIPIIKANAEAPLTFVCNAALKPLIETWFDFADAYIWLDKSKWNNATYRDNLYNQVRQCNASVAYTTLFTRNFRMDDMMLLASNAGRRCAWDVRHHTYFPDINLPEAICTESIISRKAIELEYFRNIEFIEKIYGVSTIHSIIPMFPNFSKQNRLLVFPVANINSKNWHSAGFAEVIKAVSGRFDSVLLLGGENAVETAAQIEHMASVPNLLNLCGKTSLTELMAFIGESRLLICPDTAALHFAIQTATDTLVLSNGNNWQRFVNYAPFVKSRFRVIFPAHFKPEAQKIKTVYSGKELKALKASAVIQAVEDMLSAVQTELHSGL